MRSSHVRNTLLDNYLNKKKRNELFFISYKAKTRTKSKKKKTKIKYIRIYRVKANERKQQKQ